MYSMEARFPNSFSLIHQTNYIFIYFSRFRKPSWFIVWLAVVLFHVKLSVLIRNSYVPSHGLLKTWVSASFCSWQLAISGIGCSMVSIWLICMQLNNWGYANYHGQSLSHSSVRSISQNNELHSHIECIYLFIHLLIQNTNFQIVPDKSSFRRPLKW